MTNTIFYNRTHVTITQHIRPLNEQTDKTQKKILFVRGFPMGKPHKLKGNIQIKHNYANTISKCKQILHDPSRKS